ncbi:MAG: hypothetical protein R3Y59_01490 [bacterium]
MNSKLLSLLVAFATITLLCFTSCETETETSDLHGTWTITEVSVLDNWIDVSSDLYADMQGTITFGADGTYTTTGLFGDVSSYYVEDGETITTTIGFTYTVVSLDANNAEFSVSTLGTSLYDIRAEKQ